MGLLRQTTLLIAVLAVASAIMLGHEAIGPQPKPYRGPAVARMNMPNSKGDREFLCIDKWCDPHKGFVGRTTHLHYASTRDAVFGIPQVGVSR